MMAEDTVQALETNVDVPFRDRLSSDGYWPIEAERIATLQLNLGYLCNQQCAHCHHESGPYRAQQTSREILDQALAFADSSGILDFDITGGAPELHPDFRRLVREIRKQGASITDRCNLTVLHEPGQEDLADFLADNSVRVAASLPHYDAEATDRVRGPTVFERSVTALRALNAVGYGKPGTGLELTLVHTPAAAVLPGCQESLECEYRRYLGGGYGIEFNQLITITNMPIGRFLRFLVSKGNLRRYVRRLERNFNPATLRSLMCRTTLSVAWDGVLYDCDFNQALRLPIRNGAVAHIQSVKVADLTGRAIRCNNHCYGCAAGGGSSCTGAVAE